MGSYPSGVTPEGVEDLAGNVLEWCGDWSGRYPEEPETDPAGPRTGASRILRGGSFAFIPGYLRAACRVGNPPEDRYDGFGFRLAWSSPGGL